MTNIYKLWYKFLFKIIKKRWIKETHALRILYALCIHLRRKRLKTCSISFIRSIVRYRVEMIWKFKVRRNIFHFSSLYFDPIQKHPLWIECSWVIFYCKLYIISHISATSFYISFLRASFFSYNQYPWNELDCIMQ